MNRNLRRSGLVPPGGPTPDQAKRRLPGRLANPQAGLADLDAYPATLTLTFDGTRDGAPQKWSKTYVILDTREPAARQLTVESQGDLTDAAPVYLAELGGVAYELRPKTGCTASVLAGDGRRPSSWNRPAY